MEEIGPSMQRRAPKREKHRYVNALGHRGFRSEKFDSLVRQIMPMSKLKKILNLHEEATHLRLKDVCEKHGANIYSKVRLADVLPIEGSGISDAEYRELRGQARLNLTIFPGGNYGSFSVIAGRWVPGRARRRIDPDGQQATRGVQCRFLAIPSLTLPRPNFSLIRSSDTNSRRDTQLSPSFQSQYFHNSFNGLASSNEGRKLGAPESPERRASGRKVVSRVRPKKAGVPERWVSRVRVRRPREAGGVTTIERRSLLVTQPNFLNAAIASHALRPCLVSRSAASQLPRWPLLGDGWAACTHSTPPARKAIALTSSKVDECRERNTAFTPST